MCFNLFVTADKNWNTTVPAEADKNVPTEKSYVCVPVVFYSKNIWKSKGRGKGLLGIQVCLVEQKSSVVNVRRIYFLM